jgi:hypothetical protein
MKDVASETGFCLNLYMERTRLFQIELLSFSRHQQKHRVYWAELSRFHLKMKTESSLQNITF